ncbi:hypothetical protein TNCV_970971 [Trichonephila clavipes]|nr:hypothetical protein TNCV_970971 [Trichonephila clavipes]
MEMRIVMGTPLGGCTKNVTQTGVFHITSHDFRNYFIPLKASRELSLIVSRCGIETPCLTERVRIKKGLREWQAECNQLFVAREDSRQ